MTYSTDRNSIINHMYDYRRDFDNYTTNAVPDKVTQRETTEISDKYGTISPALLAALGLL
jgi:hypothetical protein